MHRLTKEQAAIIGAFTGVACGPFSDVQELVDQRLGIKTLTHEFADEKLWEEIRAAVRNDFIAICHMPPSTT
jgi:hypothetical protein